MTENAIKKLINAALAVRESAYAPYSGKSVGAAVLTADGQLYCGCNIENASYAPSLCAERVALAKAVSEGARAFQAIAICGGPAGKPAGENGLFYPCGVCRQMLAEFCAGDLQVICACNEDDYQLLTLAELLPHPYPPDKWGKS